MVGLKIAAGVLALLVALLLAQMLFAPQREPAPAMTHGMPWQIELPAPGQSRVFGLTLGGGAASTLADARRLSAEVPKLALLTPQDAPPALEAYFESISLGALTGKLVLSIAASPADLESMRANAANTGHLETGIRQGETLEHFLYPAQGLDIVLDSKGKEVLQYVAPADFARLRAPLGK